jgi:hypothetical protein
LRPTSTAAPTPFTYTGRYHRTPTNSIGPEEELNHVATPDATRRIPLPKIDNEQEYHEAMFLKNELEANGLHQYFSVLWNLGVREPLQLQHVIKTDFDESGMPITLAQLRTLQKMGKKSNK